MTGRREPVGEEVRADVLVTPKRVKCYGHRLDGVEQMDEMTFQTRRADDFSVLSDQTLVR